MDRPSAETGLSDHPPNAHSSYSIANPSDILGDFHSHQCLPPLQVLDHDFTQETPRASELCHCHVRLRSNPKIPHRYLLRSTPMRNSADGCLIFDAVTYCSYVVSQEYPVISALVLSGSRRRVHCCLKPVRRVHSYMALGRY